MAAVSRALCETVQRELPGRPVLRRHLPLHNSSVSGDVTANLWHQLQETQLAPPQLRVTARLPLPVEQLDGSLSVEALAAAWPAP